VNPLPTLLLSLIDANEAEALELHPNQRLLLTSPEDLWMIESGQGDLFSLDRQKDKDEGPLTYLSSLQNGSLLFGFPQKNEHVLILFIANQKTRLKKINKNSFTRMYSAYPDAASEVETMLSQWVTHFLPLFNSAKHEHTEFPIKPGKHHLQAGNIYYPHPPTAPEHKQDFLWINIISGEVKILSQAQFKLTPSTGLYPLGFHTRMKCTEETTLEAYPINEALKSPQFWESLNYFHEHILQSVHHKTQAAKASLKQQNALKNKLEEELLNRSFHQMSSVLGKESDAIVPTAHDPLIKAMQLIGSKQELSFTESKNVNEATNTGDKIAQICRASQVRFRKVILEKNWWKEDSGPILGFYETVETPVALILNAGNYEVINPLTSEKIKVDDKVHAKLSKVAYTFYQPFPDGKLTGPAIIKFCLRKRWKEILLVISTGAVGALLSLFPPFANEIIFNQVIEEGQSLLLPQILVGLVVIAISTTIFLITRSYASLRLGQLIDSKLESALWDRILNLPATFFRKYTAGNLIQRIYAVSQMHQLLTGNALKVILSGLFSVFYFITMVIYSGKLAFLGFIVVFVSLVISATCIIFKTHFQRKMLEVNGDLNGTLIQLISGIAKLRVAGAENRAFSYWSDQFTLSKQLQFKSQTIQNIVTVTTSVLPVLSSAVLFTAVINMLSNEAGTSIRVGTFIAFMAAYVPFSQAIFDAINTVIGLVTVVPLWERAKVILQAEPEISKEKTRVNKLTGNLAIDHVFFRYEKEGMTILRDVSIHVNSGEFIGIVGPSGCGKSTIVRLLLGFETPEKGTISYDGIDLHSLDLKQVRRKIGVVLQNGAIFSGSIHENIACGGSYTHDEIRQALELSGFGEDLKNLPMGLHTILQSGGGTLSGGQAQRLLIARALISNPKILIFDEATSALDAKTQNLISHNLDKINVTRIVIAHRLNTIQNADRIYVMEKGQVVDSGTFSELSNREGLFKQMLKRQML